MESSNQELDNPVTLRTERREYYRQQSMSGQLIFSPSLPHPSVCTQLCMNMCVACLWRSEDNLGLPLSFI